MQNLGNNNTDGKSEKNFVGNGILEFFAITVRHKWFLFFFIFIITAAATTAALLSDKWYKSTASVFPAEQTDFLAGIMGGGLSSLAKNFSPSKGLASLTGTSESDKYIAILKSGTVLDSVIRKFDLVKVYEKEKTFYEKTVKELVGNLEVEVQDEGNLTVTVYDKDPKRAADMANYFIQLLNQINSRLSAQSARANRIFVEKRYMQNLTDIEDNELKMKEFQKKHGVVAVDEQLEGTVKQMAQIYANLAEKEVQFNILRNSFNNDEHPLVRTAKMEIEELKKKIDQINTGENDSEVKLMVPLKKAPELAGDYLKIFRNLEIQYKILEFITPLYEQAKVEEVRATPSVVVLDNAYPAERKTKPKISLYFLIAFLASTFTGLVIVFTLEGLKKIRTIDPEKYDYIKNSLKIGGKKKNSLKEYHS